VTLFNDRRSATTIDLTESAGTLDKKSASTLGLNSYGYSGGKLPERNDMPTAPVRPKTTATATNMR